MVIYNFKINGSRVFKIFLAIILILIICLFSFGTYKIFIMAKNESSINNSDISCIQDDNYTNVLKSVHDNLNDYIGKKINFSGYVYRIYDFQDNEFVLARDMVISSDNQTVVVGFMCENKDIKNYQDGTWINITGEIAKGNYHGEIPVIKVTAIKECEKPENEYVYPPDENYLQTPEI